MIKKKLYVLICDFNLLFIYLFIYLHFSQFLFLADPLVPLPLNVNLHFY